MWGGEYVCVGEGGGDMHHFKRNCAFFYIGKKQNQT